MKFYLIGILGTGMVSLAQVLFDLGHFVTGSDTSEEYYTKDYLINKGIKYKEFNKVNINDESYVYIASSSYRDDNVEVRMVKEKEYTFFYYHEFLAFFFSNIRIGISGTHGKTTTTSFVTDLFCDKKCVSIIGDGRGKGVIDYDYFIFEACEYRDHILSYSFDYLIINNIDRDHLDYFNDKDEIYLTFEKASKNCKTLVCHESVLIDHNRKYTFGKSKDSFCFYDILSADSNGYLLDITINKEKTRISLPYCGEHMINNFLASFCVYYLIFKDIDVQKKIDNFNLIRRRMETYSYKSNILIDDYAHHPTEIEALIKGVKQKYPNKKIIVIFQPHTYTRTLSLQEEFKNCFKSIDKLYLYETFTSKREKKDVLLDKKIKEIFSNSHEFNDSKINKIASTENSVIIFLGAGIVNKYIKTIITL